MKLRSRGRRAGIGCMVLVWVAGMFSSAPLAAPADDRPRIVAFGDSLTAGLGVAAEETYPAQLQRRLDALGLRYRVVNAGVSGETTAGGVRRIPWILRSRPEIVILELGGNDGLRGLRVEETRGNLEQIIQQVTVATQQAQEISEFAENQANSLQKVSRSVAEMDVTTQQNAAMVEESNAASRTLKGEANALKDLVDRFLLERRDKLRPSADKGTWKRGLQGKQAA